MKHYADAGKLQELVEDYEKKVEALPDDVAHRIVLARLYVRAGEPTKAHAARSPAETVPAERPGPSFRE